MVASSFQVQAKKNGVSFAFIGDYSTIRDMRITNKVFDAMALMKKEATPGSPEDIDFIIPGGDNAYVIDMHCPMDWEINWIKELYTTREPLANLPLYPVRGNHDSYWYN